VEQLRGLVQRSAALTPDTAGDDRAVEATPRAQELRGVVLGPRAIRPEITSKRFLAFGPHGTRVGAQIGANADILE
jgi:hypothetical protein